MIFCVWFLSLSMFSRFIHMVTWIGISFLFMPNNIPLYGCTRFSLSSHCLKDTWIVSAFLLLSIAMLSACPCKVLFAHLFPILLGSAILPPLICSPISGLHWVSTCLWKLFVGSLFRFLSPVIHPGTNPMLLEFHGVSWYLAEQQPMAHLPV